MLVQHFVQYWETDRSNAFQRLRRGGDERGVVKVGNHRYGFDSSYAPRNSMGITTFSEPFVNRC